MKEDRMREEKRERESKEILVEKKKERIDG